MANPPITIGPFDNVPAPGSPIRSDWAQEISQWVTNIGPSFVQGVTGSVSLDQFGNFSASYQRPYSGPPGVSAQIVLVDGTTSPETFRTVLTNVTPTYFTVNVYQNATKLVNATIVLSWMAAGVVA